MSESVAFFLLTGPEMPHTPSGTAMPGCRMIHTFIWALDLVDRGGDAKIILEGEAPKWLLELPDPKHGRHPLYRKVCKACAVQAQALEAAAEEGLRLVYDASGHVSVVPYLEAGYHLVTL
jgi:hypothetical protein